MSKRKRRAYCKSCKSTPALLNSGKPRKHRLSLGRPDGCPGVLRVAMQCDACRGWGFVLRHSDSCTACHGEGMVIP
jgi:DnaJ-class molecular chaperone